MTETELPRIADQSDRPPAEVNKRSASLLQRIARNLRDQNWTAIGIEFVVVVFGVFLAFQLNNWNEERIAQEAGQTYRARIVADLRNNAADLEGRNAYTNQLKAFGLRVLGDLDRTTPLDDEQFLIAAYQATQIYTRPLVRAAYDEVLATGTLNSLGDDATRDRISNYYLVMVASEIAFAPDTAYRDTVRSTIPYAVQNRIRSACAEVLETGAGTALGRTRLPETCTLDLSPENLARAASRVRATPGLELTLTHLLADLDQKLVQATRSQERVTVLLKELAAKP